MPRKNKKDFTTISIKRNDLKKLEKIKIHPNQPIWEVIKKILKYKNAP